VQTGILVGQIEQVFIERGDFAAAVLREGIPPGNVSPQFCNGKMHTDNAPTGLLFIIAAVFTGLTGLFFYRHRYRKRKKRIKINGNFTFFKFMYKFGSPDNLRFCHSPWRL
jgi:hypothetical protein